MRGKYALTAAVAALLISPVAPGLSGQAPTIKLPEAGVSQVMTLEAKFVRAAYNNEGYVILGYQTADYSLGDDWMLLEMGTALRDGVKAFKLTRDAISLSTPDGATLP